MSRKRALGKGLDALIPPGETPVSKREGVLEVSTDLILPNPRQPRHTRDDAELQNLADSIQEHGVLQPLVVLPANTDGSHELIAGERRLEAARLAGLSSVPVVIRIADERQQLELALIENLQREDLNPLEAAEGYRQLAEDFGLSHEEIAEQMGKAELLLAIPSDCSNYQPPSEKHCNLGRSARVMLAHCSHSPQRRHNLVRSRQSSNAI